MSNFKIDFDKLEHKIYKKAYKLSDVKDKIEKVAWDVVRFKDSDQSANLWKIESSDEGDYIVAVYEETPVDQNTWEVIVTKQAGDLQISYKGDPIVRVASSKLGIPKNEVSKVPSYLPEKLANNKKLVLALLNELSGELKQEVLTKYPELKG